MRVEASAIESNKNTASNPCWRGEFEPHVSWTGLGTYESDGRWKLLEPKRSFFLGISEGRRIGEVVEAGRKRPFMEMELRQAGSWASPSRSGSDPP